MLHINENETDILKYNIYCGEYHTISIVLYGNKVHFLYGAKAYIVATTDETLKLTRSRDVLVDYRTLFFPFQINLIDAKYSRYIISSSIILGPVAF